MAASVVPIKHCKLPLATKTENMVAKTVPIKNHYKLPSATIKKRKPKLKKTAKAVPIKMTDRLTTG